ncbi:MAG: hypothetical protein K6E63_02235 [Lachnospiraceae bacterium]|nr:hypothetical protein [Lachnospiraceae bacterium]
MDGEKVSIEDLASVSGGRWAGEVPTKGRSTFKAGKSGNTLSGNTLSGNNIITGQDTKLYYCPVCKKETEFDLFSGGRAICSECGEQITL